MNKFKLFASAFIISLAGCAIKPKPLHQSELKNNIAQDKLHINRMKPRIQSKNLSLNRAIARSIKYNFEARMKALQQILATTDLKATSLTMLPQLAANAGYISRSNINEVLSPSGQVSTAEDRKRRIADLQLNWSLIDFGISYYMSKQKADDILIAEEARRKMIHLLAKQTREAFWNAYTSQNFNFLEPHYRRTLKDAIYFSEQAQREELIQPLEAVQHRRDMWDTASKIQTQKLDMSDARPKLLSLIHAPSKQRGIRLITTREENQLLPRWLPLNLQQLEEIALEHRPELRQEIYKKRITLNDVNKARLQLIPNPSVGYGGYYDSNSFLVNNNWLVSSLNVAWDLLSIPNKLRNVEVAGQKAQIADLQRLGLAMAIVTQVEVAKTAFVAARDLHYYRSKIYQSDRSIYQLLKAKKESNFASQLAVSKAYITMMHSKLDRDKAYADYQTAAATLLESIGLDVIQNMDDVEKSVNEIIKEIQKHHRGINNRKKYGVKRA